MSPVSLDISPSSEEWILKAAFSTLARSPCISFSDARALANELHHAWPALSPQDAVRCFFAPTVVANSDCSTIELI